MPKRRGYILPELCVNDNLEQGYHKSKHGKTYVYNMLKHREFDPNEVLTKLQQDFYKEHIKLPIIVFSKFMSQKRELSSDFLTLLIELHIMLL